MFSDYKEIIGLIASFVILVALIMPNIKALRIINMFGAIIMVVYGVLIAKVPVIIMNTGSGLINLYYLIKIFRHKPKYSIVKTNSNEEYYNYISKDLNDLECQELYVLMKDDLPIRFLSFEEHGNHLEVHNYKGQVTDKEISFINNYIENITKNDNQIIYTNLD